MKLNRNNLILCSLFLTVYIARAQFFKGSWLEINELTTYSQPAGIIKKFKNNKLYTYSLDSLVVKNRFKVNKEESRITKYYKNKVVDNYKYEIKDSMTYIEFHMG